MKSLFKELFLMNNIKFDNTVQITDTNITFGAFVVTPMW